MQLPKIQINQGNAQIGMTTTRGELYIQQPHAELNLHQEPAKIFLSTEKPQLEIDSRKAWSALARANFDEITDRIAQNALRTSMEYIGEIAQDGDRMMAIQNHVNAFAEIARNHVFKERQMDLLGEASYDNVDVQFTPGTIKTEVQPGKAEAHPEIHKPVVDYYPGRVNPYLIQKNYIFFSSTGENLDAYI
ncbi:DUF6470 family protein [Paenibacillus aceris]|uniref:Archaellin n=1 Tax=Paenibacillus aceris TaxID=869555 RepID=A0ABS4I4F9_9BACL|nr:DUF6470 family protein [Paenibacillus aceris]MBP1965800.1 archaellin [Paenibacillus aceris]NHW34854.1 hypothetical protein [Paenibacillus aceris]